MNGVEKDIRLLKVMKEAISIPSGAIAEKVGLEVFQITARLKSMEKRGLVQRNERGHWHRTPAGTEYHGAPPAQPAANVRITTRTRGAPAAYDRGVPIVRSCRDWRIDYLPTRDHHQVTVFTDTEGIEWIEAEISEQAHLIFKSRITGLGNTRLRRFIESPLYGYAEDHMNERGVLWRTRQKIHHEWLDEIELTPEQQWHSTFDPDYEHRPRYKIRITSRETAGTLGT